MRFRFRDFVVLDSTVLHCHFNGNHAKSACPLCVAQQLGKPFRRFRS